MKSKPIPTSPQNHPQRGENQTFERPRKRPGHYIFLAIVLSIIFGFLSGLVAVFSSDYLSDHIPVLKSVLLQAEPFSGQVIVRGTDNFITERNKAITNLQNNYGNSLVGIPSVSPLTFLGVCSPNTRILQRPRCSSSALFSSITPLYMPLKVSLFIFISSILFLIILFHLISYITPVRLY